MAQQTKVATQSQPSALPPPLEATGVNAGTHFGFCAGQSPPSPRGRLSSWCRHDHHKYARVDGDKVCHHQIGHRQAHEARASVTVNPLCLVLGSRRPSKQKWRQKFGHLICHHRQKAQERTRGNRLILVRDSHPLAGLLSSWYCHGHHKQVQAGAEEAQGSSLHLGQRGCQDHRHRKRQQPCRATHTSIVPQYGTYSWIGPPVHAYEKLICQRTKKTRTNPRPPLENCW